MPRYSASQGYIDRELAKVSAEYDSYAQPEYVKVIALRNKRLQIDLAEMLTGPTCGAEAERLSFLACNVSTQDVAEAMREASDRYFGSRVATPVKGAFAILSEHTLEGMMVLETECSDFDAYKKLPSVLAYKGVECTKTGWSSDTNRACYKQTYMIAHGGNK